MWASLALTAVSTAASIYSQMQTTAANEKYQRDQADAQNKYMEQNAKAANSAFFDKTAAENNRMVQEQQSAAEKIDADRREADRTAGTAFASGEAFGSTLVSGIYREHARTNNQLKTNLTWEQQQAKLNIEGYRSEALDRVNSVRSYIPQPVQQPNYLGSLAQFGSSALGSYTDYMRNEAIWGDKAKGGQPKAPADPAK
ncbi:hypothetical protein SAMN04244559_02788 [Magnetospirillum fulvum]|uniref:Internal virion protein B n=2 Tax=Magnetospirillum fulvum TaxID=1082 RepID=A0A1H6IW46_MAGFU|nr:hypothetical protein SAMN04244559_02788 [Magnetospirillum fulvum]